MFTFPGQRSGESVLLVIRKHPIVHFKIVLVFLLTILLPLGLFLWFWFHQYPFDEFPGRDLTMGIFVSMYLLFGLLFSCVAWIDEEFDIFILTNERLIDITQVALFERSETSMPLEKIQDATSRVDGFLRTLLDYGDVEIQTASGDATHIFIDQVPKPSAIAREIMEAAQDLQEGSKKSLSDGA